MGLFGTSGIRGIYETEITVDLARKLGAALAKRYKKIVIARDHRLSGPILSEALGKAAAMIGAEAIEIGICPTPAAAFAGKTLGADCVVVVTASHNPPAYNGFKFFNPDGSAFSRIQEAELAKLIEYAPVVSGRIKTSEISKFSHNDAILKEFAGQFAGMKVVLNCNGGAATATAPALFEKLGCIVYPIFDKPDGEYVPNPKTKPDSTLGDWNRIADVDTTERAVADRGADVGIIYDGDADRLLAIAPNGAVAPDKLLYLFCAQFYPGANVVDVVDGSSILDSVCNVTRVPVGDVNVSHRLKGEGNFSFGGESCSGVYIWPSLHYCPDGIYSSVKLLQMVREKGSLDALCAQVPENFIKREKVSVPNEFKLQLLEHAREKMEPGWKINDSDGIRVDFPGSWFLLRPSGTEPLMRITVEAETEEKALALLDKARKLLE
ncbi:MAG: hypothetical protein V1820_03340 [archaeon]